MQDILDKLWFWPGKTTMLAFLHNNFIIPLNKMYIHIFTYIYIFISTKQLMYIFYILFSLMFFAKFPASLFFSPYFFYWFFAFFLVFWFSFWNKFHRNLSFVRFSTPSPPQFSEINFESNIEKQKMRKNRKYFVSASSDKTFPNSAQKIIKKSKKKRKRFFGHFHRW